MPDEPTFPSDAAVGAEAAKQQSSDSAEAESGSSEGENRRKKYMKAGVAVGIGSAAIVAALLYANRGKRTDKGGD